jgi:RNA polymerase sigma factor (sigma-70 family)
MHKSDQQSVNNILLEEAMPAIRALAREVHEMHGPMKNLIPYDDLVSEGTIGALQAVPHYDPGQGSFLRFARPRIRGWMTDLHRRRGLKENSMLRNSISLDGSTADKEQSFVDQHNLPDKALQTREYQSIVSDVVDTLPWREATILRRTYLGGLKLWQVGDELGVCASRILQLRRKACAGMRAALAERGIDAGEFKKGSVPRSPAPGVQDHGHRRVRAGVLHD